MKQIKTIRSQLGDSEAFDKAVNHCLAEGWVLTKRMVLPPYNDGGFHYSRMLYAELEIDIITDAEKCCDNCAYCDYSNTRKPCADCDDDCSCWEEAER